MLLGNSKWEHTLFNSRLQPTEIGLGTSSSDSSILKLQYGYGTTSNNGNVMTQTITAPGLTLTQCYSNDALNRLLTAEERSGTTCTGAQQWSQTYDYDRWGNRAVRAGSLIPTPRQTLVSNSPADLPLLYNQGNNRIQASAEYDYDFAGNLKKQPNVTSGADQMSYDGENRQTSYTKAGGATTNYFYDGDGRRVKKAAGSVTTVYVYNVMGQLIAEYTSDPVPPAAGGGGTSYLTQDHLGSTRIVTKADGSVKARYDYLPFGEEIASSIGGRGSIAGYGGADSTKQKFTSKERDTESGLDFFGARYYSSAQGRFASPDPLISSGIVDNPQTWNRYGYVLNNPLSHIDPFGLEASYFINDKEVSFDEYANYLRTAQWQTSTVTVNGQIVSQISRDDYYSTSVTGDPENGYRLVTSFRGEAFAAAVEAQIAIVRASSSSPGGGLPGLRDGGDFGGGGATDRDWGTPANRKAINTTSLQLQKKFPKHAKDFGVTGNYNKDNSAKFEEAIQNHVNDPGSKAINGEYNRSPATIYVNPTNGLAVITDRAGNYISGWKLSAQQLQHVLTTGKLGGHK